MKKIYRYTNNKMKDLKSLAIRTCLAGRPAKANALVLTSSPRSGSTWLGNLLRTIPNSCVLFEPLNLNTVPDARTAGFSWRTYVHPESKWKDGEAYLQRVFEGKVLNQWTTREMSFLEACRCKTMIVKFVRANRLLPWICRTFDICPPIVLLRHPCAVVASQLKYDYWKNVKRPETPTYIDEYPLFKKALSNTADKEEYLAALWALDQLPILTTEMPHPWIKVTYEELYQQPEVTLQRIFHTWNLEIDTTAVMSQLKRPSSVVSKSGIAGISGWQKGLNRSQVEKILETTNKFGLRFYTEQVLPDYEMLYSVSLPDQIRKAGQVKDATGNGDLDLMD